MAGAPARQVSEAQPFRAIHYLGSKLRLLEPILDTVREVGAGPGAAVDLFAGSGTVSLALAQDRPVIAVDIQEYSRVICAAMLGPPPADAESPEVLVARALGSEQSAALGRALQPLVAYEQTCVAAAESGRLEPICELVEKASLLALSQGRLGEVSSALGEALGEAAHRLAAEGLEASAGSLVTRYFGGPYFSFAQSVALDALLEVIHAKSGPGRDAFLAAALSTASDVVNTVGKQFAQPIRPRDGRGHPKAHLARQIVRDRSRSVPTYFLAWAERYRQLRRGPWQHQVTRLDYREFLQARERDVAVVYADPPYTRDHYSRYYHVLETLCLWDNPKVSTMRVGGQELLSRGFYREGRHQSPFCIKSRAPGAFGTLFEGVRRLEAPLVLSYSPYRADERARPRLMTVEEIVTLARRQFRSVEVRSVGRHAHHKLNHQELNTKVFYDSEVLIVCVP